MDSSVGAAANGRSGRTDFRDLLTGLIRRDGKAIEELAVERVLTTASVTRVLAGLAGDPISFEMGYGYRPDEFYREVSAVFRELAGMAGSERQRHDRLRGFLGFMCFTMTALKGASERGGGPAASGQVLSEMRAFLADRAVRDMFHERYRPSGPGQAAAYWRSLDLDSLEVHRVGTTSFILKCRVALLGGEARVLKCLLFPYTRIRGIAGATLRYAEDYPSGKVPCTVPVYASTDKWILMDFAAGPTLQEVISAQGASEVPGGAPFRAGMLASVGPHLLDAVHQLHDAGFDHRDLAPSNVIVVAKPDMRGPGGKVVRGEIERLVLIDLGRNYLFARQSGIAENRETGFVAPEVRDDAPAVSSDMYSLGMILAELADPEGALGGVVPDGIYRQAPYLARFIEDLIDANPAGRLLIFGQEAGPNAYSGLRAIFADLLKIIASDQSVIMARSSWTRSLLELFLPSSRQVGHRFRIWRETRSAHTAISRYSGYLLGWSIACTAAWYAIFSVALLWGLRDVGVDAWSTPVTILQKLMHSGSSLPAVDDLRAAGYEAGDWRVNLPAALVAFSIGLAGTRFYQNIFAGLTTRGLRGRQAFLTEVFLRGTTFGVLVPATIGNLVQPRWWPWLVAIGYIQPTTTCLLCYSTARRCLRSARKLSTVQASLDPAMESFGQWWTSMAFLVSGSAVIAAGLQLGWLHDYWFYALWLCAINIVQMYAIKCAYYAPVVRGALARAFIAGERWENIQARPNRQP